ncbi:FecR domain-containing protein, partial [Alistipes shahii]
MEEMKFDQEEMRRLAGRYFAGEIAAEEERELFRFVTSDAACRRQFAAWRLEWEAMPASDAATDRDWRRLRSRIRLQGSARSARPGRFAAVWRAAAAVAVVCATFFGARLYDRLLLERATERYTVTTKSGDRSTVCLPDGTQVRLNGSSTLTYPANFNATNRSVELSGAAYFDVSPDEKHRFEVKVGNCSVVVKGTKFDVTAYPDDSLITTTLLEG